MADGSQHPAPDLAPFTPDRLIALRHRLGLTQDQMAEEVGCGRTTVRDLECGACRFSRMVENAIRWVELVGAQVVDRTCQVCNGVGLVTPDGIVPRQPTRRHRCPACNGEGVSTPSGRVIL